MIIDLEACLSTPGFTKDLDFGQEDIGFQYYGIDYAVTIEPFHISLNNVEGNKFRIDGKFNAHASADCDRCLKRVPIDLECEIEIEYPLAMGHIVFDDECGFIEDHELDVVKLLQSELLINWPAKVLCSPSCKGICPKCGKDLNTGECGCDRVVLDPRMAKFAEVFQDFKEV